MKRAKASTPLPDFNPFAAPKPERVSIKKAPNNAKPRVTNPIRRTDRTPDASPKGNGAEDGAGK